MKHLILAVFMCLVAQTTCAQDIKNPTSATNNNALVTNYWNYLPNDTLGDIIDYTLHNQIKSLTIEEFSTKKQEQSSDNRKQSQYFNQCSNEIAKQIIYLQSVCRNWYRYFHGTGDYAQNNEAFKRSIEQLAQLCDHTQRTSFANLARANKIITILENGVWKKKLENFSHGNQLPIQNLLKIAYITKIPAVIARINEHYSCTNHQNGCNCALYRLLDNGYTIVNTEIPRYICHQRLNGNTTMLGAAVAGDNVKNVRILLNNGADPDSTYYGHPCLMQAINRANAQIVELLLINGASVQWEQENLCEKKSRDHTCDNCFKVNAVNYARFVHKLHQDNNPSAQSAKKVLEVLEAYAGLTPFIKYKIGQVCSRIDLLNINLDNFRL